MVIIGATRQASLGVLCRAMTCGYPWAMLLMDFMYMVLKHEAECMLGSALYCLFWYIRSLGVFFSVNGVNGTHTCSCEHAG